MNDTLEAVIITLSGDNVSHSHIDRRGAFGLFPEDALGGSTVASAGRPITLGIGPMSVETDIDETLATFRERTPIGEFFEDEKVLEGDLVLVQRATDRSYQLSNISKRIFKYYL